MVLYNTPMHYPGEAMQAQLEEKNFVNLGNMTGTMLRTVHATCNEVAMQAPRDVAGFWIDSQCCQYTDEP